MEATCLTMLFNILFNLFSSLLMLAQEYSPSFKVTILPFDCHSCTSFFLVCAGNCVLL